MVTLLCHAARYPLDASGRQVSQREAERTEGVPEGWTDVGRCHIHNRQIGVVHGGKKFPWEQDRSTLVQTMERLTEAANATAQTLRSGASSASLPAANRSEGGAPDGGVPGPPPAAPVMELPHQKEMAERVEKILAGVHASYFPLSRMWDLRDDNRLMDCVIPAHIRVGVSALRDAMMMMLRAKD
jgi:hypothetical protein